MSSANPTSNRWLSYFSDNVLLDEDPSVPTPFIWCNQQTPEHAECSLECIKSDGADESDKGTSVSKKRSRDESVPNEVSYNKANREKMRRDRLNDRFLELSQALEPGKPPKTDKATILCDAVRILCQLRTESKQLKEGNAQLKEQIKELKAEKNELRDEKARLKTEKERLESQIKTMTITPGFMPHPAAMQAAAAALAAQAQAAQVHVQAQAQAQAQIAYVKPAAPMGSYPTVPMWQWLPPSALDTSQDHVLRPPVA